MKWSTSYELAFDFATNTEACTNLDHIDGTKSRKSQSCENDDHCVLDPGDRNRNCWMETAHDCRDESETGQTRELVTCGDDGPESVSGDGSKKEISKSNDGHHHHDYADNGRQRRCWCDP